MTFKASFKFKRGEVYLVEEHAAQGSEQQKTRPWVLVGSSSINSARSAILAVPLSTKAPIKPPLSISVCLNNTNVVAVIDQLRSLDKRRFLRFEGELSIFEMNSIDDSLRSVLAL
ncbi:MAG: type II toxin-antitoxin system PemK/MazF family toxin [Gammaproteobacteria bacterium]|nr:type II toxin-antitoxin system PemK/MazF family toxin [Gammaproteobacteria bacterium]